MFFIEHLRKSAKNFTVLIIMNRQKHIRANDAQVKVRAKTNTTDINTVVSALVLLGGLLVLIIGMGNISGF